MKRSSRAGNSGNGGSRRALGAYIYACPNCGGPIGDDRLFMRIPCAQCLPEKVEARDIVEAAEKTAKSGSLRRGSPLEYYARVEREAREVEALFEKATGSKLWSAQRTWVKRVLKGKSFAVIAPTGVGKTTFGVLMAVYFASKGEKSYIVVPTTPLVKMVEEKASRLAEQAGIPARIVAIHSKLRQRERNERWKRVLEGEFDILITTSRFMINRARDLVAIQRKFNGFRFVFVDDVDAVLKSGRSVDALLEVIGFTKDDIEKAWQLLRLRRELARFTEKARRELERTIQRYKRQKKGELLTAKEIRELRRQVYDRVLGPVYREHDELVASIEAARTRAATLVVSSATGRPRGSRVRLFSVLLGFQAGSRGEVLRNIVDAYVKAVSWSDVERRVVELVKRLGGGGLVYVPVDKGSEYAAKLAELLRSRGVRAEPFTSKNIEALERFRSGETDVLVGVAIYYGVAVRGLDLPERIRYAVFAGVPRLKFSAKFEEPHPLAVIRALSILAEHAPREVAETAEALLLKLRRIVVRLSPAALAMVAEELAKGEVKTSIAKEFLRAAEFVRKSLSDPAVWKALEEAPDIAIVRENGKSYILVPDTATYIQASGRTSRLVAGGLTKGLSIVVADDPRLLEGLIRRTKWFAEAEWHPLEEVDLDKILEEIDRDRQRVRAILEGRIKPGEVRDLVKTALLVVESPNKARTIAGFFGKPSARDIGPLRVYEVSTGDYVLLITASGGHVYDLVKPANPDERLGRDLLNLLEGRIDGIEWVKPKEVHGVLVTEKGPTRYLPVYSPIARCLVCGYQWTVDPRHYSPDSLRKLRCPFCGSQLVKNSWDSIEALRDIVSEVDLVLIGTDPDTEGEKIGWDTAALIAPMAKKILRVEFHEITRKAITHALHESREFEQNLVKAQIVRRVEDRWIGFTLSPILWHRFWRRYCEAYYEKRLEKLLRQKRREEDRKKELGATINGFKLEKIVNRAERIARQVRAINNKIAEKNSEIEKLMEEKERICGTPNYNLSAGRVQTPVLGWIVENTLRYRYERYPVYTLPLVGPKDSTLLTDLSPLDYDDNAKALFEEIEETITKLLSPKTSTGWSDWYSRFEKTREILEALYSKTRAVERVLKDVLEKRDVEAIVEVLEEKEVEVKPPPPFTTDAMLAEATARLRLGAPEVMRLAQDLFELGFITYHRTDSTRVSDAGIGVARDYLREKYGDKAEELFTPRKWGEGGAHEAIRPTRPIDADRLLRLIEEGVIQPARPLTRNHYRLYDLIFRRFIASQMKPARLVKQAAKLLLRVGEKTIERMLERYVEVVDKGFLDIYPIVRVEDRIVPGKYRLPDDYKPADHVRRQSIVPPLSQADTVRLMKERGIGRPSTYAKIIDTLLRRAYAVSSRGYLFSTERGRAVYTFLSHYFHDLVSEETTRELQTIMDRVERGELEYQEVLDKILMEIKTAISRYSEFKEFL